MADWYLVMLELDNEALLRGLDGHRHTRANDA